MLFQKHRPASFDQLVGQRAAVTQVRRILQSGWGGRAWWISGPSGTGKTSLAYLIAATGADKWMTEEIDASDLTPQRLKEIDRTMPLLGMGEKFGRCWIVNEAHGLRRSEVIRQLLTLLERLPPHVVWIFTTTDHGEQLLMSDMADADPLLSRCHRITLAPDLPAFARLARRIAVAEGLDGQPESVYRELARTTNGNMRAMLQAVESGAFPKAPAASRPARRSGGCQCCGAAVKSGKKFCGTDCYFKHLSANKRKR
jgi:replication-associated recombination protein RarA